MMDMFLVEIMLHLIMQTPYNLIEGRFTNRSKEHLTSYLPKSCQRVKCSFELLYLSFISLPLTSDHKVGLEVKCKIFSTL